MNKKAQSNKTPVARGEDPDTDDIVMTRKDIITRDKAIMGGRPCIRGQRVTVGAILGQLGSGKTHKEIFEIYPTLNEDDILAALEYAMWRCQDVDIKI